MEQSRKKAGPASCIVLPDHRAVGLRGHSSLSNVAVRADVDIEKAAVGSGQRLCPMVVERGGKFRHPDRRTARPGLSNLEAEPHKRILIGDIKVVACQREPMGSVAAWSGWSSARRVRSGALAITCILHTAAAPATDTQKCAWRISQSGEPSSGERIDGVGQPTLP